MNARSSLGEDRVSREFAWTDDDFTRVKSLIYKRAGIHLHDGKHAMVYSRLSRRLRETGYHSFREYLGWLENSGGDEWQEFVNALTTNLTSFFRENHHFEYLFQHLKAGEPGKKWNAWCAAASTGEEPYSIVMTALDALGPKADFHLVSSDIDSKVLATAERGMYKHESVKGLDTQRLHKYFLNGKGANTGFIRAKQDLSRLMDFAIVNLIKDDWPFDKPFDLVFCRNVMIYFDAPTQQKVLESMHRVIKPGGLLFVGHAENLNDSRNLFLPKGKTIYTRC